MDFETFLETTNMPGRKSSHLESETHREATSISAKYGGSEHDTYRGPKHRTSDHAVHADKVGELAKHLKRAGFNHEGEESRGHVYAKDNTTVMISHKPNLRDSGRAGNTHHHIEIRTTR